MRNKQTDFALIVHEAGASHKQGRKKTIPNEIYEVYNMKVDNHKDVAVYFHVISA